MAMQQYVRQIEDLQRKIEELQGDPEEEPQALTAEAGNIRPQFLNMKSRRVLRGHFGKVYAMSWSGADNDLLVSASQDGKLIIWNGKTTNKLAAIPLRSSWVMTCGYSVSGGFVACGGLDNLCSVYRVPNGPDPSGSAKPVAELAQHEGYLSCARFINDEEILTASGDSTVILWDIQTKTPKSIFADHEADVMTVSVCEEKGFFVSGSCDATARMWDHRRKKAMIKVFHGHESDINTTDMFPGGSAFGTGSDDSSCRVFDVRALRQIQRLSDEKILCGITSVGFSKSGRHLFAGYDDFQAIPWDILTGQASSGMEGHENRVSCLGVNRSGSAVATGSWDAVLRIWA